jgi:hypothetical protein
MNFGLDKKELYHLSLFAPTEKETREILFKCTTNNYIDSETMLHDVLRNVMDKNIELILANNQRITEQLERRGIK